MRKSLFRADTGGLLWPWGSLPRQTAVVGDQIFTDILGANLAGMASILVEPFQMEPFFVFVSNAFWKEVF